MTRHPSQHKHEREQDPTMMMNTTLNQLRSLRLDTMAQAL